MVGKKPSRVAGEATDAVEQTPASGSPPHRLRDILAPWLSSFFASFLVFAVIGFGQIGQEAFWRCLIHPHADHGAFDLLLATIIGAWMVFLAVYLGGVATILATASSRSNRRYEAFLRCIGSWWLFFPGLVWFLSFNLLLGPAWGFPRFWLGLPVILGLGLLTFLGFGRMGVTVAALLSEEGGLLSSTRAGARTGAQ
ncbi:MAG: hypothetical protein ABSB96_05130 [Gaiellaceae bacterium]